LTVVNDHYNTNATTNASDDGTVSGATVKTPRAANDNFPGPRSFLELSGLRDLPGGKLSALEISRANTSALSRSPEVTSDPMSSRTGVTQGEISQPLLSQFHSTSLFPGNEFDSLRLKLVEKVPFADLVDRLGFAERGKYTRIFIDENARFGSWNEFNNLIKSESRAAFVYKVGPTEVVVEANYHARLEEVRQLRIESERVNSLMDRPSVKSLVDDFEKLTADNPDVTLVAGLKQSYADRIADASPKDLSDAQSILKARIELEQHPLRHRVLPADLVPMLKRLPAAAKINRVELLDEVYVKDKVANRNDDGKWTSSRTLGTADRSTGTIRLFPATEESHINDPQGNDVLSVLKHEQVHLNHDDLYEVARDFDEPLEASNYGYVNFLESEAELESKAFLSTTLSLFLEAANRAPFRMALLARKLTTTIEESPAEYRSFDDQEILARARYIETKVLPGVTNDLMAKIKENYDNHAIDLLVKLHTNSSDPAVQEAFLSSFVPSVHELIASTPAAKSYKRAHVIDALMQLLSTKPQAQAQIILNWAQPDSPVPIRNAIRAYLSNQFEDISKRPNNFSDLLSDGLMAMPPGATNMSTGEIARYSLFHGDDLQMLVAAFKLLQHSEETDIPHRLLDSIIRPLVMFPKSAAEMVALLPDTLSKEAWMDVVLKSIDSIPAFASGVAEYHRHDFLNTIAHLVPELRTKAQRLLAITQEQGA
jgi:hypothetical protein